MDFRRLKNRKVILKQRFWEKVDKKGEDECWNWLAHKTDRGYGQFHVNGKHTRAHRTSYELNVGEIPKGLHVLHKCDNPPCVNPRHLFLGTHKDNIRDMYKKGRDVHLYGEQHGNSKLNDEQIKSIILAYSSKKCFQRELAVKYGITQAQISNIITGKQRSKLALSMS